MSAPAPACRFCGARLETIFADLGVMPLANRNLRPDEISDEKSYPLIARVCEVCLLAQVDASAPREAIFSSYDYLSSATFGWVAHAGRFCRDAVRRFNLDRDSFVVEVASNDGYLLRHFVEMGIPVLGVEPAANVAKIAIDAGVPTLIEFFGVRTALDIAARGRKADLIVANNVLAHAPDTRDFTGGFARLLAPEGVAVFEFPHVMRLIDGVQFDTIYHEHFYDLSLTAVENILRAQDLRVCDAQELSTHGGSLRLFVCHASARHEPTEALTTLRRREHEKKLDRIEGYLDFSSRIAAVKASFLAFLASAKRDGKTIAGYGAAAKGATFLNYCGVNYPSLCEIYDRSQMKQGKITPGSHIPIFPPERIAETKPDYVLILPWNIATEVRANMAFIEQWGGRFVTAIPHICIYEKT